MILIKEINDEELTIGDRVKFKLKNNYRLLEEETIVRFITHSKELPKSLVYHLFSPNGDILIKRDEIEKISHYKEY